MEKKPRRKRQSYKKIDLTNDITRVANESPDKKLIVSLYMSKGNYPMSAIVKTFGTWKKAVNQAGLKRFHINTENQYLEDIKNVANQFPDLQLTFSLYNKHGKFGRNQINNKFGNFRKALQKAGINNDNKIKTHKFRDSEKDLLNDLIKTFKHKKNNESLNKYYKKNGKHSITSYYSRFGSWKNALQKAGIVYEKSPTENEYLEDIKQVANQFPNLPLTSPLYDKYGKFKSYIIIYKLGCWTSILQKVGIINDNNKNLYKSRFSEEDLLNDLIKTYKHKNDNEAFLNYYLKNGNHSISTYHLRFGSWKNALKKAGLKYEKYTENEILEDLKQVANQFPDFQLTYYLYRKHGKFSKSQINNKFHKWSNALQKAGINNDNKIKIHTFKTSEEDLLNDLKQANELKKSNESLMTYYRKNGKHDISTYIRRFGSWKNAVEKTGFIYEKYTKNDILADIKQVASQFPDLQLSYSLYLKHGKFNKNHINNKFHKWSNALQKAGINNDNKTKIHKFKYAEEELLNDLKQVYKLKKNNESFRNYYLKNGKHAIGTFQFRFGSWKNALEKTGLLPKNDTEALL